MSDLLRLLFSVQDVLLEESILPVHMRAVEQSIAIDDLIKVVLRIVSIVVFLILDVILVTANVALNNGLCWRQSLPSAWLLESEWAILAVLWLVGCLVLVLLGTSVIVKGLL